MADNLPLIPDKNEMCSDVRPVLREVFRELDSIPPLVLEKAACSCVKVDEGGDCELLNVNQWAENYAKECAEIWKAEVELKHEHAERISRTPLQNIYKIYSPKSIGDNNTKWMEKGGQIKRKDLVPTIAQNAGRDTSLWVKNIFNGSSGDVTQFDLQGTRFHHPIRLSNLVDNSLQSLSIEDVVIHPAAYPIPESPPPPQPEYIICVPPHLDFLNFTVGQLYTQGIRLVNISKFEVRLSLRPPARRELAIELCGSRGLTVTSGSAAELKVHFRPRDVRAFTDVLQVRVSIGKSVCVPLACYMQPPLLDILVPCDYLSAVSKCPKEGNICETSSSEVLELGAKLLGDVHSARILLHCDAEHTSFFILPEDSWLSLGLDGLTTEGAVMSGDFTMCPAWWRGGGTVHGCAWCAASHTGLHVSKFRILCSTAIVRQLDLIADSLYFRPNHLTLVAHEKDYDICSEDDPDCDYFVHLGTAFPNRSLSATIQLVNHSPVMYSYYWSVRPWGVCSCGGEGEREMEYPYSGDGDEELCAGALVAKQLYKKGTVNFFKNDKTRVVRVDPAQGHISPRSTCALHVCAQDVGNELGVHRTVLMLILRNIPKESFPPGYDPMIVKTTTIDSETIPNVKGHIREVCEVVCCQLEVWWEVAPIRFVLDPCTIPIFHSRRINSLDVSIRATQLFGCDPIRAAWGLPKNIPDAPVMTMTPSHPCEVTFHLSLPSLPDDYPDTDIIKLVAANEEWKSQCSVTRQCTTRHLSLWPAKAWLGVVPPGKHMNTMLEVVNDTYQKVCWWSESFRWWRENVPSPACIGRPPCENCQERICSCALLRPSRGVLTHGDTAILHYDVNAPESDGCVATLIQVKRTRADVSKVPEGAGTEARAALVAYRVLAPRLVMRLFSCGGKMNDCCDTSESCLLDQGALKSERGTATLRPLGALTLGRRTCYILRFTNITPLPTNVAWDTPIENEFLRVLFYPNRFNVKGYDEVETRVVLEARKVCGRRVFVCRAQVADAYNPLYLLIDAAIAGLEITCEIPVGDELHTDSFITMRRNQREDYPWEALVGPRTPDEIFADEDRKRATVKENICDCKYKMVYIPPKKPSRPPPEGPDAYPSIEIVWDPLPLSRVCPCSSCHKPTLPDVLHPCCLQFRDLPLRTVRSRTITLRNDSVLTAKWSAAIRRWPRHHRRTINADQWAGDVRDSGVVLHCEPSNGVLAFKAKTCIEVQVYADSWGVFHDQVMILVTNLTPIILDVWIEAVGPPIQFAIKPTVNAQENPILWLSASDPERILQGKNVSRTELNVQAYVLIQNDYPQVVNPFRLYFRFVDVPPRACPCVETYDDEITGEKSSNSRHSSCSEEMDTWMEIYLAPDYGEQGNACFKVSPEVIFIEPGAIVEWTVALELPLHYELASACNLVLRMIPKEKIGEFWYRPDPPAQVVTLKQIEREGIVRASCKEVRVKLCALDLPHGNVLRIRKRFRLLNVGNGPQILHARTEAPWSIVLSKEKEYPLCGAGCLCSNDNREEERKQEEEFYLEPRSSLEICVEVSVDVMESRPPALEEANKCMNIEYPQFKTTKTLLIFYDQDNVHLKIPLILELEYPKLIVEPTEIDFGFVTDGDTRKTYFTVSHSSRNASLSIITEFIGCDQFKVWPPFLRLEPNKSERIYVQYNSMWSASPAEGRVHLSAGRGSQASAWCRVSMPCRATASRDHKFHVAKHDYTDDTHLLPPDIKL